MASPRGPQPKPTALRVLEGNPSKRPLPEGEPNPEPYTKLPPAPAHLDDTGKREWRRMGKRLMTLGLLTELDEPALVLYCDAWSRYLDAQAKLRQFGLVIRTRNGSIQQSPYVSIANGAWQQLRQALAEFGMSPSSRTRVKAASAAGKSAGRGKWDGIDL